MNQFLDKIVYGNPTDYQLQLIAQKTYLDKLSDKLKGYPFPASNSQATTFELKELVEYQNKYKSLPEKQIRIIKALDADFFKYYKMLMVEVYGFDAEEISKTIDQLIADAGPLIYKLKYFYNRPRPYQLAPYFKVRIFPHHESVVNSPSYPSEKAFIGGLFVEVFGNKYPQVYESLLDVQHQLNDSRKYLGLNFTSDLDFSMVASKIVSQTPEFCTKYGI